MACWGFANLWRVGVLQIYGVVVVRVWAVMGG